MDGDQSDATPIMCDNQSTIATPRNPIYHCQTKHIDIRYHFTRELTTEGKFILKFSSSADQTADIFTKTMTIQGFHYLN